MASTGWGSTRPWGLRCRGGCCGRLDGRRREMFAFQNKPQFTLTHTYRLTTQALSGKQNFMSDKERTAVTRECNEEEMTDTVL